MARLTMLALTLAASLLGLGVRDAAALMQIAPTTFEMTDGDRSGSFTVTNLSEGVNRIEFTVVEEIGDQQRDASDEFIIFPPLTVLEPEASQVVRFQFAGSKAAGERKFYIFANELTPQLVTQSVEGADAAVKINLLVRMGVLVRVSP